MKKFDRVIQVVAMEPAEEAVLRVNNTRTAFVLGGSVPSAVPPDLLSQQPMKSLPVQGSSIVKSLTSILLPPLCPPAVSAIYRFAVLLIGSEGKLHFVNFIKGYLICDSD